MLTDRDHHWLIDVWQTLRTTVLVGIGVVCALLVAVLVWLSWILP